MRRVLFIDRDGTLIREPEDKQIDSLTKLALMPHVIPALLELGQAGFRLVMISNQDGLGTESFPREDFEAPHNAMLELFTSQGVLFDDIHICPHFDEDRCECRKPRLGLVKDYLRDRTVDLERSHVIGDRDSDMELARRMGVGAVQITSPEFPDWRAIAQALIRAPRRASVRRQTRETTIDIAVDLDGPGSAEAAGTIATGIGFFDHMLEQLAKHSGIAMTIAVQGDLHIDEHHTVEDTALALGQALRQALGDKIGIARYGFVLPMDEAQARVAIDLSARPYLVFEGAFGRETVGGLPTELVPHFFRSLADSLGATLHVHVTGDNAHHMIEGIFKAVARSLGQAVARTGDGLPSTKGTL